MGPFMPREDVLIYSWPSRVSLAISLSPVLSEDSRMALHLSKTQGMEPSKDEMLGPSLSQASIREVILQTQESWAGRGAF